MHSMLKLSKTGSYSVPVVQHTLDILELLYRSDSALKMNEISNKTGTAHSTTYRILRTLADRGYIVHHIDGGFTVNVSVDQRIVPVFCNNWWTSLHRAECLEPGLSSDQVIEILFALLQNVRPGNSPTSVP